ncbi:hypothetical protein F2Q70_00021556 [Brassica cretica]|uniref:Uncharacterized protein n=1 Tax=Brassica cretica TaxID=69181 RepID=A0A8S9GRJ6_BRACR|nr:hypothetical protein F2Q70_00021556 [Brassica cretica]KAF3608441.1 hypothetical protein DY000_02047860 [Brassica cretica]
MGNRISRIKRESARVIQHAGKEKPQEALNSIRSLFRSIHASIKACFDASIQKLLIRKHQSSRLHRLQDAFRSPALLHLRQEISGSIAPDPGLDSMTKSSNKGKTVGEKYSGIEFLQTPGRTPASGSPLGGTPVPRYETEVAAVRAKVAELEKIRDRDICRGSRAARREDANSFLEVLASLEKRWVDKKKEVSAEIQLHKLVANLDLLNEIKNEGLVVDEEIVRLEEMEKDCEVTASWAAVPDWSVADLDLPQISEDSVVNDAPVSSSSGEGASS